MKNIKKLLTSAVLSSAVLLALCVPSACSPDVPSHGGGDTEELKIFQRFTAAMEADFYVENVTVTTTDTRTDKFGLYVPKTRAVWTENGNGKSFLDRSAGEFPSKFYNTAHKSGNSIELVSYFERLYEPYDKGKYKNTIDLNDYAEYKHGKYTGEQWIGRFVGFNGEDWFQSCKVSQTSGGTPYGFDELDLSTFDGYSYVRETNCYNFENIYYTVTDNMNVTASYACSFFIKLDAQNRLSEVKCGFNGNGAITSAYVYGNASVDIPQNLLDLPLIT